MRLPREAFAHCPACGHRSGDVGGAPFECTACGFVYYFNPAVAAAALVVAPDGRGLFIRRSHDPAKGKLALVGGFVDPGESLEEALRREVREEVNIELTRVTYLSSHRNEYTYRGLTYPVVDVFFVATADRLDAVAALDAVESVDWLEPCAVSPDEIAFSSMRDALAVYCRRVAGGRG